MCIEYQPPNFLKPQRGDMRVALGGSTIKKITARSGLTNPLHTRKDRSDMSIYSSRHAARAVICIGVTAYRVCLLLLRYIALNPDPSGRSMLTALIHLLRRWGFRSGKMTRPATSATSAVSCADGAFGRARCPTYDGVCRLRHTEYAYN